MLERRSNKLFLCIIPNIEAGTNYTIFSLLTHDLDLRSYIEFLSHDGAYCGLLPFQLEQYLQLYKNKLMLLTQQLEQFRESFSFLHHGPRIQDASKVPMCGGFASPMVYCVQKFCIHRHPHVFCCGGCSNTHATK